MHQQETYGHDNKIIRARKVNVQVFRLNGTCYRLVLLLVARPGSDTSQKKEVDDCFMRFYLKPRTQQAKIASPSPSVLLILQCRRKRLTVDFEENCPIICEIVLLALSVQFRLWYYLILNPGRQRKTHEKDRNNDLNLFTDDIGVWALFYTKTTFVGHSFYPTEIIPELM